MKKFRKSQFKINGCFHLLYESKKQNRLHMAGGETWWPKRRQEVRKKYTDEKSKRKTSTPKENNNPKTPIHRNLSKYNC